MRQVNPIRSSTVPFRYLRRSLPTLSLSRDTCLRMTVVPQRKHTAPFEGGFASFWSGVWMRR